MVGSTLSQYLNYTAIDSSVLIDDRPGGTSYNCAGATCLKLHNGGILLFRGGESFGGTGANNGIPVIFDPDGVYSGSTADGPSKSVIFVLYYNGKITSFSQQPTFTSGLGVIGTGPDPSWFSW